MVQRGNRSTSIPSSGATSRFRPPESYNFFRIWDLRRITYPEGTETQRPELLANAGTFRGCIQ